MTLKWLKNIYHSCADANEIIFAMRVYLLHLVGYTIFVNKSEFHTCAHLLLGYAWGASALTFWYDQFSMANQHHTM
ncbi:hypothetical protein CR513_11957, partial [Mucuna pruriens]